MFVIVSNALGDFFTALHSLWSETLIPNHHYFWFEKKDIFFVEHMYLCECICIYVYVYAVHLFIYIYMYTPGTYILEPK